MATRLRALAGVFILSVNDVPAVLEIFAGFALAAVATTYTIAQRAATRARELLMPGGGVSVRRPRAS